VNVLVVGGAGFVGGAVTDALLGTNHRVRVFDVLLYEDSYSKPIDFVHGDVRNPDQLRPHLAWAGCVIWLAARVAEATCDLDPRAAEEVNVGAVKTLRDHFGGRIIFTSTSAVYGRSPQLLTEESAVGPRTLYSRTKVEAEHELANNNSLIFRLGTLYGVGDEFSRPRFDLVVNTMTLAAATTGVVTVFGGEQYRPFLHVRDAADAIVGAIGRPATGIFNLHSENVRIVELADRLLQQFGNLKVKMQSEIGQSESYRLDSEKARGSLAFAPKRRIEDGIHEVRMLVESGRIADLGSPRFRNHLHVAQPPKIRSAS
jgi:nucleoside-diphosphate-sugar epimerase